MKVAISIFFIGPKLFFPFFLALFSKSKSNVKVNVLIFTQMIFPDALSFPTMGERCRCLSLSYLYWNYKTSNNFFFLKCLEYNMHLKWYIWTISCLEGLPFLIGKVPGNTDIWILFSQNFLGSFIEIKCWLFERNVSAKKNLTLLS